MQARSIVYPVAVIAMVSIADVPGVDSSRFLDGCEETFLVCVSNSEDPLTCDEIGAENEWAEICRQESSNPNVGECVPVVACQDGGELPPSPHFCWDGDALIYCAFFDPPEN